MQAKTQMQVDRNAEITVSIQMTVEEMQGILKALEDVRSWPVGPLKSVLSQSLRRAHDVYFSEEVVEGL